MEQSTVVAIAVHQAQAATAYLAVLYPVVGVAIRRVLAALQHCICLNAEAMAYVTCEYAQMDFQIDRRYLNGHCIRRRFEFKNPKLDVYKIEVLAAAEQCKTRGDTVSSQAVRQIIHAACFVGAGRFATARISL